ncbi:MAG: DNA-binding response regulator [Microbacterium sp. 14-71-5]|jgi:DNA-binding response OmpR family regulator|uniref:response regulator transcription factor n=1 Tax=Microbacterium sp. 13-71-7 TaxID=1970399 RepID=UPI000BD75AC9|nr:response regulator transcription factor [Microbacterium sp. 13-71-7]OZB85440.1 MAG: DNA-binding response regulator [Microbacterium sp. 13-71-7]OZB88844.1 MAG: DNA-binding response regulator [Microbacterium sp. 14-71-5]
MKILIVEDDERVADALAGFLGRAGYAVERAGDGRGALDMLGTDTEAVILDLGLPDIDGIELCRRIRAISGVPILIATARSQVHERIRGLRAGADDFLVKPYDVQELLARIEAVTRRSHAIGAEVGPVGIDIDGVRIDLVARRVLVDGEPVELTRKEFDIVAVLARYPGVAVPRERLIREVWNTDWQSFARSLEVHVASIRRKLARPALIETVRGVGYRLTGL